MPPAVLEEGASSGAEDPLAALFKPMQERVRDLQTLTILQNTLRTNPEETMAAASSLNDRTLKLESLATRIHCRLTADAAARATDCVSGFAECSASTLDYAHFLAAAAGLARPPAPAAAPERSAPTAPPAPSAAPPIEKERKPKLTIPRVTEEEFLAVGQHLRGRLPLAAVNAALDAIEELLREKQAILSQHPHKLFNERLAKFKAWSELASALPDIKGPFLTDDELAGAVFKADATGRSLQTVLRSVQPPRMRLETRAIDGRRLACYLFPLC